MSILSYSTGGGHYCFVPVFQKRLCATCIANVYMALEGTYLVFEDIKKDISAAVRSIFCCTSHLSSQAAWDSSIVRAMV